MHLKLSIKDPPKGTLKNPLPISFENQPDSTQRFKVASLTIILSIFIYNFFKEDPAKFIDPLKVTTTFADVRGIDECRKEMEEIVSLLNDHEKYEKIGAKVPRGILLTGEPGTGKTLMAKAIAGQAGVKFIACSASEFDELIVGLGAKRIRDLFKKARESAPAIIFIDEIDSVGGTRRGRFGPGLNSQSLNQLLVEMDGFQSRENVIVIAATNRPEVLDDALKRPGRFDKTIHIPKPDLKARQEIAELYLQKVAKDSSVSSEKIAKGTVNFTGADIANLINTAILCAIRAGRQECNSEDIEEAKDRLLLGVPNRSMSFSDKEKYIIALSEIGQALIILETEGAEPLHKTSILVRGENYGKTSQLPEKDLLNYTKEKALAQLDVLVSGKVMQDLALTNEEVTDKDGRELGKASSFANRMVMGGLFRELFGLMYVEDKERLAPLTKKMVDSAVSTLMQQSYSRVTQKLKDKVDLAKGLAQLLVEKESLSSAEVSQAIDSYFNRIS
jgi:ATP-dependent metalloprotease